MVTLFSIAVGFLAKLTLGAPQTPPRAEQDRPWKIRLTRESEPGTPMIVAGRILGPKGQPLRLVKVYVYQTDNTGVYNTPNDNRNPRIKGTMWTNADGRFEFRTIRPKPYPGSTTGEHFHFELSEGGIPFHYADVEFWGDRKPAVTLQVYQRNARPAKVGIPASRPAPDIKGERLDFDIRIPSLASDRRQSRRR